MWDDKDLKPVCDERRAVLDRVLEGRPRNCVLVGTLIETRGGSRKVEELRPGDEIVSIRPGTDAQLIYGRVARSRSSRASHCVRINGSLVASDEQQIRTEQGWCRAGALSVGLFVFGAQGQRVRVEHIDGVEGDLEIYDLSIDGAENTYLANGILCHNKH